MSTIGNARQAASYRGYDLIVPGWSNPWADVNLQGGVFDNALLAASYMSHAAIVRLLLENGARHTFYIC
jgi:ankyrin repeat protein